MAEKKPKKPSPRDRMLEPTTISKEVVFEKFREMYSQYGHDTSLMRLHREIMAANPNEKLSYSVVVKWAADHGWRQRCEDEVKDRILNDLRPYLPAMTCDAITGLQGKMIDRLRTAVEDVVLVNPQHMQTFIECIIALSDVNRGNAGEDASTESVDTTTARLREVFGQVTQLRPTKR